METRLKELGAIVRREREGQEVGAQPELAKLANISFRKVSDVERGVKSGVKTYEAIERALGFPPGSFERYLAGGPVPEASPPERADDSPSEWVPVIPDEQIIAMSGRAVMTHYVKLERNYGTAAADDWLFHAVVIRRDARIASRETLATDGL